MNSLVAIYDFELFPYALGDVLTWNVRTAMRCEEEGKETVDIYICVDKRYPAGIYQRGLVTEDNFELFFSELYAAFGTHPRLGNLYIFRDRDAMISDLTKSAVDDHVNLQALNDYLNVLGYRRIDSSKKYVGRNLKSRILRNHLTKKLARCFLPKPVQDIVKQVVQPQEDAINAYFIKCIHSHEAINQFAAQHGRIPLLAPSVGCSVDVDELIAKRLKGKRIVPFHLRLRRLDAGYGGEHSYERDSDFLEWYDFLRNASIQYPDVVFVALGRLQEKPLELLSLPNVLSLRLFGMGLGHELTLMLRSEMFMGTSSGFAAFANFSSFPYFITRMNPGSCHAYAIPEGADRLPFAYPNQYLIYEQETSTMLMRLLELGLGYEQPLEITDSISAEALGNKSINIPNWLSKRNNIHNPSATTCRFFSDTEHRFGETAFLLMPAIERARKYWIDGQADAAGRIISLLSENFGEICTYLADYQLISAVLALESGDVETIKLCRQNLLALEKRGQSALEVLERIEKDKNIAHEIISAEFASCCFDMRVV